MKTIFVGLLLSLSVAPVSAQSIALGFRGGLNSATIHTSDTGVNLDSRTAIHFGGVLSADIQEMFALQFEVLLSTKGFKVQEGGESLAFELSYLQIPILAKVKIPTPPATPIVPHFFAGPTFGFEVGCDISIQGGGVSVSSDCDTFGADTKAFDYGVLFGGGITIGKGPVAILIDVAFDFGIANIDDSGFGETVRNRTLMASVGLMFPLR